MKNLTDVQTFIESFQTTFPEVDYQGIIYTNFTGSSAVATVGRHISPGEPGCFFRNGEPHRKDPYSIHLKLSDKFFKLTEHDQCAILYHEFAHMLQYTWLTDKELSQIRNISITNDDKLGAFTSYHKNLLEVMAEAFAIDRYGYSIHQHDNIDKDTVNYVMNMFWDVSPYYDEQRQMS